MRQRLPNFVTLINLFCGCAAVVNILNAHFIPAFYLLIVAGFADYVDGLLARLLEVHSPIGKELDSLADMVSFGVTPGAILYMLLAIALDLPTDGGLQWMATPGFIITLFACLRLAKFNTDTRQSENFLGLNTPAATIFVTGLMLIYEWDTLGLRSLILQPWLLYSTAIILSLLLVAEIPMISFKFKNFQWKGNEPRFIFLVLSVVLFVVLKELAFSILILLYILYSITQHLLIKN
jgi:CDP-diacylglycerol--serine O-phosphatidyltransferase